MFYVYVYLLCIYAAYFYSIAIRTLEIPTHLEMDVVKPCMSRIGTLVVVYNRAVIEIQSRVRLVVAKDVTPEGLTQRKVVGQKQCRPAAQHYLILLESAPCKNSEPSCLESRRTFDGVNLIRNTVDTAAA